MIAKNAVTAVIKLLIVLTGLRGWPGWRNRAIIFGSRPALLSATYRIGFLESFDRSLSFQSVAAYPVLPVVDRRPSATPDNTDSRYKFTRRDDKVKGSALRVSEELRHSG